MRQLAPGEPNPPIEVDPGKLFVPTDLSVSPGERYGFKAEGKWRDLFRKSGAEGWGGGWLTRFARVPGQPFFRLCGAVGRDDESAFAVDLTHPWTVPDAVSTSSDRQLYLFANDLCFMYGNNHAIPDDPLRVTITRLA